MEQKKHLIFANFSFWKTFHYFQKRFVADFLLFEFLFWKTYQYC